MGFEQALHSTCSEAIRFKVRGEERTVSHLLERVVIKMWNLLPNEVQIFLLRAGGSVWAWGTKLSGSEHLVWADGTHSDARKKPSGDGNEGGGRPHKGLILSKVSGSRLGRNGLIRFIDY